MEAGITETILSQLTAQVSVFERADLRKQLADIVHQYLLNDFPGLVQLLYRVDVSEEKLKERIAADPDKDAALIIADMLIERQEQKLAAKRDDIDNDPIAEEEIW